MKTADFSGKTVFVTGAASGIGYALAEAFSAAGSAIIATDVVREGLDQLSARLQSKGGECRVEILDVSDEIAFEDLARRLSDDAVVPDIVINNAGIAHLDSFANTEMPLWQRTFDINVMGVVHGSRTFIKQWRQSGKPGHLVNIASGASVAPMPNMAAYAASKYAVEGLCEVLAMELANSNIKVSCVHPGVINTAIVQHNERMALAPEQVKCIQRHYQEHGVAPGVVAEAIIRGVKKQQGNIFVGPGSTLATVAKRLLPRPLFRKLLISEARKLGYL